MFIRNGSTSALSLLRRVQADGRVDEAALERSNQSSVIFSTQLSDPSHRLDFLAKRFVNIFDITCARRTERSPWPQPYYRRADRRSVEASRVGDNGWTEWRKARAWTRSCPSAVLIVQMTWVCRNRRPVARVTGRVFDHGADDHDEMGVMPRRR